MGTIHGFYSDFDVSSIILSISATLLAVLLLAMTIFRKDKRHLGDLLAHTQVQPKKNRVQIAYPILKEKDKYS